MSKPFSKSARFVAIETLCRLQRTSQPVDRLIEELAEEHRLKALDRHLAMNLIYGVLRQRQYLDACLIPFIRQPLKKLHPFVHQALAVGLFQLLFLDRIPESAAVNETIKAMKMARLPERLQGFANGVLRTCIRQRTLLPAPGAPDTNGRPILNHPTWLTDRWRQHFGEPEAIRICACNNTRPRLVVRVNPSAVTAGDFCTLLERNGITTHPGIYAPAAIILPDYHGPIHELPGFSAGFFQVQSESAQLVSLLLAPFLQGGNYLDGCAGPGGKTGHLLELTTDREATVTAVEPDPRRCARLQANLARLHPRRKVNLHCCSFSDFSKNCPAAFHGILLDAPCSGTGVIRRHPDIRWNRQATDLPDYHRLQLQLMQQAAAVLLPNGVLVYATCSLEPEENSEVIASFLRTHPEFALTDCAPFLPTPAREFVHNGFFHPLPTETLDGFFAARLIRRPRPMRIFFALRNVLL